MQIPKAKFSVGDPVFVRCEEAGCPPSFEATVTAAQLVGDHIEYGVREVDRTEGGVDGYTEEWLSPRPVPENGNKMPGQLAYEAYCGYTGWKSLVSGAPLPQWEAVRYEIKNAWHEVASELGKAPPPYIGPDPLKEKDLSARSIDSVLNRTGSVARAQAGVPDQMMLAWRFDVSRLRTEVIWRRAAMGETGANWVPKVAHEIAGRLHAMNADCNLNNAEVIEQLIWLAMKGEL